MHHVCEGLARTMQVAFEYRVVEKPAVRARDTEWRFVLFAPRDSLAPCTAPIEDTE